MSTKAKVFIGLGTYFAIAILMLLIFPPSGKNEHFQPQNEFKLEPWISLHLGGIDLSINKAVLYLALASGLTIFVMVWIAAARPMPWLAPVMTQTLPTVSPRGPSRRRRSPRR